MQYVLNPSEKIVLETIRKNDYSLKSKIVEKANLPWTTVTTSITSLIGKQWVESIKDNKEIIRLNYTKSYFIGIALGSSNIKVAITDMRCEELLSDELTQEIILKITSDFERINNFCGERLFSYNKPNSALWCFVTPDNYVALSNILSKICNILLNRCSTINIAAICFVFPGHIDIKNQTIVESVYSSLVIQASNIESLLDYDVLYRIKERNIRLFIDHNVKTSTSYELSCIMKDYKLQFSGNLAVIYMGLGIGMGIVINGQLYRGGNQSNLAGQFGHIYVNKVSDRYIEDYFRNQVNNYGEYNGNASDTLENILRKDIFYKIIQDRTGINEEDEGELQKLYKSTSVCDLKDGLLKNDIFKQKIAYYLGNEICNIVKILSITSFVFSGKLAELYSAFKAELQYVIMKNNCQMNINIIVSNNGEFSAALGAAEMAYRNIFEIYGNLE